MKRTLIVTTSEAIGKEVKISGWISRRRDHGKLIFLDVRDRSGTIQAVIIPDHKEVYEAAKEARAEYVIEMEGLIKERPGGASKEEVTTGGVEMEVSHLKILSRYEEELPVDISQKDMELNLETLLNYRTLTLRNEKINSIFKVYAKVLESYADFMRQEGFLEIKTPKILSAATEGGANFFKIKYFDRDAYLAQSPQFYKQAGVGIFERVFEVGPVFRAEPHFTTRHVNEYVSLDAEMGFIESFEEVMSQLEKTMAYIFKSIQKECQNDLERYQSSVSEIKTIPRLKLTEALDVLKKEFRKETKQIDIDPEGERMICEWAKKKYESDFIFLTHYPAAIRPFYTMPSRDPQYTESFDLLYRGVEIASGGQRIHDYNQLVKNIKKHNLDPKGYKHYLDIFRYSIPPHGGWGLGSERIAQKIFGLKSIKEAILFPRDVKRLAP